MKANNYFRFLVSRQQLADWLVIAVSVALGCFLVTRFCPYPSFISDSFGYVLAALEKRFIAFRPYGYSVFLRFIHVFSHSLGAVIVSQALLYILTLGMLLLALKKYWPPKRRWAFLVFEVVVCLSPMALFLLNSVLSDGLHACLLFALFALVIVMIQERSLTATLLYGLVLYATLHVRYSAMFYPIALLPILALIKDNKVRIPSILLTIAAFCLFHYQISNQMEPIVGKRQFSTGFDGWQLSSNALHVLPHLDEADLKKMPKQKTVRQIHEYCLTQSDFIREHTGDGKYATPYFLWANDSPLKTILFTYMQAYEWPYYNAWVWLGSGLFTDYGKWLILHYPGKFARYYLLPNMRGMFLPGNLDAVGTYYPVEPGKDVVVQWFDVPTDLELTEKNPALRDAMRPILPWIELLTWLVFLAAVVFCFVGKGAPMPRETVLVLWALFLFGFIYYGTTTFASPIAIRYWLPMHAVKLGFAWIVLHARRSN